VDDQLQSVIMLMVSDKRVDLRWLCVGHPHTPGRMMVVTGGACDTHERHVGGRATDYVNDKRERGSTAVWWRNGNQGGGQCICHHIYTMVHGLSMN
jgi:hypothetical protein